MADEHRCRATKADGSRCEAPARLVDPDTGYCSSHDPEKRERMREAARMGGKATARRFHGKGLTDEELPPLTSHDAAEEWADAVGRAAATDRLSPSAANAALRAVKEWREAHEAGEVTDEVEALREQLQELVANREPWRGS